MTTKIIAGSGGGKGGGGGSSPKEASDNLHSMAIARVIDILSEGEIEGLVNGLDSIYLDDTPVTHEGLTNFKGLAVNWRNGTADQTSIPGFPAVENGVQIGVEVTQSTPWVKDFTNLEITSVRVQLSVPQLLKVDTETGDTNGHEVEYAVDVAVDGGPYTEIVRQTFTGKSTSKYERSHDILLPAATSRRTIRVRRSTPNANSGTTADRTYVDAVTEIIDGRFNYPLTAVIGLEVSSEHFQSVPRRAYHIRGMKIRVPDNYDPHARTYFGVWQGGWKIAWTNNPAWVFMDLATNTRYGLGDRVPLALMDKWALYEIARYCDQMVPDGFGGTEPRFTINTQIMDRENAYDLLQKIASVFQGMAYYASGIVTAVADSPKDPTTIYSNSDVIEGRFEYSGTPKSTRYTVALVGWQNHKNFAAQEVEYVEDREGLLRYGLVETQMTAFGCSSRGQANRAGRWALLTSQIETQLCTFSVGLKGLRARPGDIIKISDQDLIGEMKGGLIAAATVNSITLDCDVTASGGDQLLVMLPDGYAQTRSISSVSGRVVHVTPNFSQVPQVQGTWAIEGAVRLQSFRVLTITEKEEGSVFELKCLQYEPGKYDAIANGTRLDDRPITSIPPSVQPPPSNVRWSQHIVTRQGYAETVATLAWDAAPHAIAYEGMWRRNEGEWVPFFRTGSTSIELPDAYAGRYIGQVRAINPAEIKSVAAYSQETVIDGKTTPPPVVTFLRTAPLLWGIEISWGFPVQGAADVQRTELWYSVNPNREDATKLSDLAYPQDVYLHMGLKAAQDFYYWVRLVDRSGNLGEFYPTGAGVLGSSSSETDQYLDAIRDEILTTDLADQLINDKVNDVITDAIGDVEKAISRAGAEALELSQLLDDAERYIREDGDAVVTNKVEVLKQEIDENVTAAITNLQEVVTTADAALAQQVITLETKVDNNQSTVTQELTSLTNRDEAIAQSVLTLEAKVEDDVVAAVNSLEQAVATADAALAQSITDLDVKLSDDISAAASTLEQAYVSADAVLAQSITELDTRISDDVQASLTSLMETLTLADSALAQQITTLSTTVGSNKASADSSITALTNSNSSLSQSVSNLSSRVGTAESSINTTASTLATTNGKLSSLYTIKTTVTSGGQRYWAGIGLGVENNPDGPGFISQILLQADRLALLNTSNNGVTVPFAVQGGQVFINNAMIQDAAITNAKIANASITNAKMSGPIYSSNWNFGVSGWYLDTNGDFFANSGQFRGALVGATGTFSGSLTANAINAVSTLNLAGSAVTIHAAASSPLGQTTSRNVTTSVFVPHGATVSINGYVGTLNAQHHAALYIDGVHRLAIPIWGGGGDGIYIGSGFSFNAALGAGGHTITVNQTAPMVVGGIQPAVPACGFSVLIAMR